MRQGTLYLRCRDHCRHQRWATRGQRFMNSRWIAVAAVVLAGCSKGPTTATTTTTTTTTSTIKLNPCSVSGTLTLASAQAMRVDCSNGGTTLTLAGSGASYLVVPQFPTDQAADEFVDYQMFTGSVAAASVSASRVNAARRLSAPSNAALAASARQARARKPKLAQLAADRALRARARKRLQSATLRASVHRAVGTVRAAVQPPPAVGSVRSFHVANSFTVNTWATVGAKLAFVGANLLLYVDTLAPANGFTPTQLTNFGHLFDQTMYPIDTTAFGPPRSEE